MNKYDDKIYRELQRHLDKMPVGYPITESGIEIKILKHLFTPEEAHIAINMNFIAENLKKIHRRVKKNGFSQTCLEQKLEIMFKKGLIMKREDDGESTYFNVPFLLGMWEFQLGSLTPELSNDAFQYFNEAFFEKEYNMTKIPQLRTIPIEKSISNVSSIASYNRVRTIINRSKVIGLMDCICRKAHDLIGDPCKKTYLRETCLTFGFFAEMNHKKGVAKLITKQEALELVDKIEQAGLVPQPSNSQKPFVICSCCGCCCEVLSSQRKFENPAQFFATNYHAQVNKDDCVGCGICEDRCQMDAITLEDKKSKINLGRCIGCGACVLTCPQGAIKLQKKDNEIIPPKNTAATYVAIMDKKAELARTEKL